MENINPCGNLWCVELKMKYNKMLYICSRNATKMLQAHKAEREEDREREGASNCRGGVSENKGHTRRVTIIKFINVEQFCISCCPGAKQIL